MNSASLDALHATQLVSLRWRAAHARQPGSQPLRQLPPRNRRPDVCLVRRVGQPSRSAAARLRLLGSRSTAPALITDGRAGAHRQPLQERLKVCHMNVIISPMQSSPTASVHTACAAHARVRWKRVAGSGVLREYTHLRIRFPHGCKASRLPPYALAAVRDKHGTGAQVYTELDQDPLPLPLLKRYIVYARAHVHPVLSDEAKQAWASTLMCSAVPPFKMRLSRPCSPAPNGTKKIHTRTHA